MIDIQQPEFGKRLKALRSARKLSQRQVAGDMVNPSYISLLETGARVPTLEVVLHLAQLLGIPVEELAGAGVLSLQQTEFAAPDVDRTRFVRDILARSSIDFGDLDGAQRRLEEAYNAAKKEQNPGVLLDYGIELADLLQLSSRGQQRYELIEELLEVATGLDVPEVLLKLQVDMAAAARDSGRLAEGVELAGQALEQIGATELAGTSEHVRALGVLISVRCDVGDFGDVPRLIEEMTAIAGRIDSSAVAGRAHWVASIAYGRVGNLSLAKDHVHRAKEMLANPATSLRDWARFTRAAANTLLDAQGDLDEIEYYLSGARSALELLDVAGERELLTLTEAKFALAKGDAAGAVELTETEPAGLTGAQLVNFRRVRGLAMWQSGRPAEQCLDQLSSAAALAEETSAFRLAAQIWREVSDLVRTGRE